ncbi:FKBP-type 22 kDa peptidyl-prolyl cis-trans isomerase [Rubripirellula lacrimiformis]|uniref:Peptidyl-prolyl cis-trans isomerase n=1 Tax=Rubripirellula lacrimiformis TaxID=1930273 RepID=A0A517NJ43_9BACT|nr:FKBP-type peptidyl-prolyl cis-trans isomerase [Rubripirellula lacrimiformis]QDT07161.1 FKBP-type 22 kDa peptidyl-prolyl cis-trans isomerase [Rubripirellula lacrimiformis]
MNQRCLFGGVAMLLSLLISPAVLSAQDADAKEKPKVQRNEKQSIGYFLGVSVGQQMSQNGFQLGDIDIESLLAGFKDGIGQSDASMSDDELRETQTKIQEMLETRLRSKGVDFLAGNAKEEGIKELAGGLQYKVLTAGDGESPAATDTVKVHYTGKLINGEVFDSSVRRGEPATFRVNQVIKGWQMALQKMKVGDKWMLYIPSDLAYGERGSPGAIGPHEVLIFEVELLEIQ